MFRGKKSVLLSHKFVQCWTKCGLEAIVLKMSDSFYASLTVCQVVFTDISILEMRALRHRRRCTPLQCSCLENPMDGGAWWAAVHGVAKSQTPLSDFTFTFHFHAMEKEMEAHSSVLAWRIPGTGEPGGLPSMGSHRVRHNWSDLQQQY